MGFIPSWAWGGLIAGVLFVIGVGYIDHHGYVRGQQDVQARWDIQKAKDGAEINRLNKLNREIEKQSEAKLAEIGETYAKQVAALESARNRLPRLRLPANACAPETRSGGDQAAPKGSDGAAGSELPEKIDRDLRDLAADADKVVVQLTACQAVIQSYLDGAATPAK